MSKGILPPPSRRIVPGLAAAGRGSGAAVPRRQGYSVRVHCKMLPAKHAGCHHHRKQTTQGACFGRFCISILHVLLAFVEWHPAILVSFASWQLAILLT